MPNTSVTTYGLPSDVQIDNGSIVSNETAKARRVQQQVQMRLAEKSTLPRQNGSVSHYATSDYGGSSTMKYQTYNPSFSSKSSYMYSGSRTMGPRVSQRAGFSSQSAAPEIIQFQKMSVGSSGAGGGVGIVGGGGGGGGYYREDIRQYQGSIRPPVHLDSETISLHSMQQQQQQQQAMKTLPWMTDGSDAGSLVSDRDATYSRQYAQSTMNGYASQMRQGAGTMTFPPPMRRALSGSIYRGGGMAGGGAEIVQQASFKGPAHRTINRITNRNRMSMGSVSGTLQHQMSSSGSTYGGGGDRVDGGFIASALSSASQGNIFGQRQGTLSRAMSVKSMQSVGRGMDIFGGQDMGASMGQLNGIDSLDMETAVQYLQELDPDMQVLGSAYIQHECYSDKDAKDEVRRYKGIGSLVRLINVDNADVQRYATGAIRNLIYENMDNKVVLIDEGGLPELVKALSCNDDEIRKNVTGIMWNLSSKETLKEKLAGVVVPELTEKILVPLSSNLESEGGTMTPSESDILYNTTGCLRNLSSVSQKARQSMRNTSGLVVSLVNYIQGALLNHKAEDKGVENAVCILRNLSFQMYSELPPAALQRLNGPTRDQAKGKAEPIGCFTPNSKKVKNAKNMDLSCFSEVSRNPNGPEWLWHPQIIELYRHLMCECETKSTTREAAAGALQNITAGDKRWPEVMSRVALEQVRILPVLVDRLENSGDKELLSVTGLLRNLSRHAKDKSDMATKVVSNLLEKLPEDGLKKSTSFDLVMNICGVLNNLVIGSDRAARDINYFNGVQKLVNIKTSQLNGVDASKASRAAATVLSNMYMYKKLHRSYKEKGFGKETFISQ